MPRVVLCQCASHQRINREKIVRLNSLLNSKYEVEMVADLCGSAVQDQTAMEHYSQADFIVACHPRAIHALFNFAGYKIEPEKLIDLRQLSVEAALELMGFEVDSTAEVGDIDSEDNTSSDWVPWNPVIDYDRCINCGKCADFCLFGVYEVGEDSVTVKNPQSCKTNCPACARICPVSAIIFPKYEKSPINGGTEIEENLPVDPSTIRKGGTGMYEKLASRRRSKRKLLKD